MTKYLLTLKPFVNDLKNRRLAYCMNCANLATKEACFDVGAGIIAIEKYCDGCAEKVMR